MIKKIIIVILVMNMMISFVGCSNKASDISNNNEGTSSNNDVSNKLADIKRKGKIVLGTAADYPPYEFHKLINGKDEVIGFDIEIAKQIASDIGVELEIIDMKFDGLLAALVTDDIDLIIAGMSPNPERAKAVDFSIPYYAGKQRMIIRAEDKDKLKEPEDFMGLKIGVQKSTTQEDIANEKFTTAEVIGLSKITDLLLELQNNKIDGIILAEPVCEAYVAQNSNLYMPQVILGVEDGIAIAVEIGRAHV